MARENNQKIKLLVLYELLKNETDENHPLSTQDICRKMAAKGIPCDRRTLVKDIEILNSMDYEIMETTISRSNAYYVAEREFSAPELKIMIDAVQAASFIPVKKTSLLIKKISNLGGKHQSALLRKGLVAFNTRKHTNDSIYYTVDFLETAIREHRQVSFLYFDLNEEGKKVYRKERKRYIVEPMALVYNEDYYYLITYNPKYDATTNYRIDRMDRVELEEAPVSEKAIIHEGDLAQYTEQVFKMYGGETAEVTLEFEKPLVGVIFDKFGEDTSIEVVSNSVCCASVTVQVSPTFFGWVSQFGGRLQITAPDSVKDDYMSHIRSILY